MTPLQQIEKAPSPSGLQFPTPAHTRNNQKTIRVALAGCGVVGGGLVRLLSESAPAIASRYGVRFVITRVLVRDTGRDRNLPIDSHLFTNDLNSFLANDADVVIEAVGGEEPARTIAISALARGRKLITANKELISAHAETLQELATLNRTGLDFGAAVGGSAPVISTLRDLVGASAPLSVRGILNGTSNFVISEIEHGSTLEAALSEARERGLAEADCARDLDGSDAAAKLSIIAWIAFGVRPTDLNVRRVSLIPGLETLVRLAAGAGGRLRLLGECSQLDGHRITAAVEPVIVSHTSTFGRTRREENRVEVDLGWSSPLSVSGPGAGGAPTAAALLSDLVRFTSPPNDRGREAARFVSVSDWRGHRWLVGARVQPDVLTALATAARLTAADASVSDGVAWLVTDPANRECAQRLVNALHKLGAEPLIARYEIAQKEGWDS
ncbi:MAG TPA: homoserine dehydrogenase [Gemmatimonadaceae bacterium]|nr:homoserine dehydrogenase [Gemmatimonadaceae bacterium]